MCAKLYDVKKKKKKKLIKTNEIKKKKINAGTEDEPAEAGALGFMPNFLEEAKWFELAGVSFGAEETLKIQKSLMKLNFKVQAKQLRFWGKIIGSKRDYYIAEGMFDAEDN